ncbi:MAG: hypothetical protein HY754_05055 [Nitrospirae bacterium]|nr:hypothetical protein [Nitrospirota bacterium]
MKLLNVDLTEIQKAMEDVSRDAFDYFLDLETGKVIAISGDAIGKAEEAFYRGGEDWDNGKGLEEYDIPEWIEDEIELAIKVFSEKDRHVRIPERESREAYSLMKKFTESIEELHPYEELSFALSSNNAFGRFKKALTDFPEYREKWFAFNAKALYKVTVKWLESLGIKAEQEYY